MTKGSSEEFRRISTLVELLGYRASHQPQRVACEFLPQGEGAADTLTYAELQQAAQAIAVLLRTLDCQGQPVLLLYPPGLAYIAAFFGCLYAGAIAVPAYPPRPNRSLERLQVMLKDTGASVALTGSGVLQGLERRLADFPALGALKWLATDDLDPGLASDWVAPAVTADSLAFLQYTSGSTGIPKGVKVSHGNLIHNSARIYSLFDHSEDSRGLSWLPPYHDMGLVGGILQPLYAGMQIVLMPPVAFLQKPVRWLQAISRYRSTTSGGPNFAYDLCIQRTTPEQRAALDLSSWQVAFSGAEPVRAETLERFAAAFAPAGFRREAFYPCYGMAETTLIVTGGSPPVAPTVCRVDADALRNHQVIQAAGADHQALVSCGAPPADQGLQIVEPETGVPCPPGQVGEIWVTASGSVTQGYWQRPQQSQETFQAYASDGTGPYLRTGDLGVLLAGELYVTGRCKELIIIRGRNYYPKDIEATVESAHVALRSGAGAAFSITIEGQERLVVVQEVERTYLRNLPAEDIVGAVRRAIAEHHDLQLYGLQLIKTGSIPKTSSGKIRRLQCREGFLDQQLVAVHTWQLQPQGDLTSGDRIKATPPAASPALPDLGKRSPEALEQWLTAWLAQQLQVPTGDIEATRPFAEYGLDSVAAVELTDTLQGLVDFPVSPTLAYEYPTIQAVAAHLGTPPEITSSGPEELPQQATEDEDIAALLNDLENLSEADVQELLGQ